MSLPPGPPLAVTVLLVCFRGRRYLDACLESVFASADPGLRLHVLAVDNASDDGSADHLARRWPQVELLRAPRNLGFAGGNQVGWEHLRRTRPETHYLALLNQDTRVARGWLGPLVATLEADPDAAAAQPKILLHPQTDRLNSAGNRSHFLGFGFCRGDRQLDDGRFDEPTGLDFPSGAAVLLRCSALPEPLFEPAMFAYLEDADLGWRLRSRGLRCLYVPGARVWHEHRYDTTLAAYRHLERNRWELLLVHYRWRTLVLLSPALLAMEAGQLLFASRRGLLREKLRSWRQLLAPATLARLRRRRRAVQAERRIGDRQLTRDFAGRIESPEIDGPALRLANSVLDAYWKVARRLIRW